MKVLVSILLLLLPILCLGQNDTITLKNKDVLVGEIKSVTKGVLTIETPYSDNDFTIKFNEVIQIFVERKCLVVLTDGVRRFGLVRSDAPNSVVITLEDGSTEKYAISDITVLQEVDEKFFNRFKARIDFGLVFTKANNTTKFTLGSAFDYTGEIWLINSSVDLLNSSQDNAERIERIDAEIEGIRLLPNKWYLLAGVGFLSNTEQALDGRVSLSGGFGRLLINTNKLYLGLSTGYNYNVERFVDGSLDKSSSELFFGTNFSMFDFEDIDLETGIKVFPSLSESNRWRVDYDFNVKYDLPLDFYVKLGFTLNYDNQAAVDGNEYDYIINSGIGWEFN